MYLASHTNRDRPGVTGVTATRHSFPNSTLVLELDKLDDHVTHDVRHSKHFKKQRKPYPFNFVKISKENFQFQIIARCRAVHHAALDALRSKLVTCISLGEIQGETHIINDARECEWTLMQLIIERSARSKIFCANMRASHRAALH